MGSLPNLHELSRESDSESIQTLRHTVPIAGPGGAVPMGVRALPSLAGYNGKFTHHHQGPQRICRTRSNGNHNHLYDDLFLEQLSPYSPVSSRSTRTLSHNLVQPNLLAGRRRESMSSSIGATSVRRLIAVVRNTHGRSGPVYSRHVLVKNLFVLCTTQMLISAAFLPLLALQSSVSAWHWPLKHSFIANLDLGSVLLSILYTFASLSSLISPLFVQKFGTNVVFIVGYITFTLFFGAHLFPIVYVLFPVYILLGLMLGPLALGKVTLIMTLASKLSYLVHDDEEIEEHNRNETRRTCLVRRIARALRGAQDIGLIVGSVVSAILISYTISKHGEMLKMHLNNNTSMNLTNFDTQNSSVGEICNDTSECTKVLISKQSQPIEEKSIQESYFASYDDLFDIDDNGDRICGSNACPLRIYFNLNISDRELVENFIYIFPHRTSAFLTSVYIVCSLTAFVLAAILLDRIRMYMYQDPMERPIGLSTMRAVKDTFKDVKLQLAAPLAVFIGLEQGFIYSDFSKSYVVCALGVYKVNLVFLSMGLLQSISAFTLSMLLRTIQRWIVIAVGFAFHACLIMVLILWKPSGDDPALFYVISAAWGVCNSIWEMLNFTLLTGRYAENWEPAFANSTFFRFVGLALSFGVHGLLCNWIKLYALAVCMVLAVIPYTFLEIKFGNTRKLKNISRL